MNEMNAEDIVRECTEAVRAAMEAIAAAHTERLDELRAVRDRREASEREAEARYRRLIQNLRQGLIVYSHDTDGVFTYVSPSVTDVLGYEPQEFLKHHQEYETDSPLNRDTERRTRLSIQGVQQPSYDVEVYHKDGGVRRLEVREVPLFDDDGEVYAVEGIALDVTEKRRMQQRLRRLEKIEAVGQLTGGIAHQYNNMLTAIIGLTDLGLGSVEADSEIASDLRSIRRIADRAATLTEQLLAFGRRQTLQYAEVDLNELLGRALEKVRRVLGETVEVEFRPEPRVPRVRADPPQIEQVLLNLARNARDAMPEGGRVILTTDAIHVGPDEASSHLSPGNYARITMTDEGVGIPSGIQGQVFDPFFTTKSSAEASGLGLSTAYGIVKQHAGHISISSEPGTGTTVRVLLPGSDGERRL